MSPRILKAIFVLNGALMTVSLSGLLTGALAQQMSMNHREYTKNIYVSGYPTTTSAMDIFLNNNDRKLVCCNVKTEWYTVSGQYQSNTTQVCVYPGNSGKVSLQSYMGSVSYEANACRFRD